MRRFALLSVLVLLAACGRSPVRVAAEDGRWEVEALGPPGEDTSVVVAAGGDRTIVATTGPDGALEAWSATAGAPFTGGEVEGGLRGSVTTAAAGDAGFVVGGRTSDLRPAIWSSVDGARWRPAVGLTEAGDVNAMVAFDGGFVAVGALRVGPDPASEPFAASAWYSADGRRWHLVRLPASGDSAATAVAAVGDTLVALGTDDRAVSWRSSDGGRSWARHARTGPGSVQRMAAAGDALVAVGEGDGGSRPIVVRSVDAGRTWAPVQVTAGMRDAAGSWWLNPYGSGAAIIADGSGGMFDDPDRCYVDPESCSSPRPRVFVSDDGLAWRELDIAALQGSRFLRVDGVARSAGKPAVVGATDAVTAWRWRGQGEPVASRQPSRGEDLPPPVPADGRLVIGTTYRLPLGTHCGIDHLAVGPQQWRLVEQRDQLSERAQQGMVYGFVTRTAPDRLEYSLAPGRILAVYAPTDEPAPDCM